MNHIFIERTIGIIHILSENLYPKYEHFLRYRLFKDSILISNIVNYIIDIIIRHIAKLKNMPFSTTRFASS